MPRINLHADALMPNVGVIMLDDGMVLCQDPCHMGDEPMYQPIQVLAGNWQVDIGYFTPRPVQAALNKAADAARKLCRQHPSAENMKALTQANAWALHSPRDISYLKIRHESRAVVNPESMVTQDLIGHITVDSACAGFLTPAWFDLLKISSRDMSIELPALKHGECQFQITPSYVFTSTGEGDGFYPVLATKNEAGEIVELMIAYLYQNDA